MGVGDWNKSDSCEYALWSNMRAVSLFSCCKLMHLPLELSPSRRLLSLCSCVNPVVTCPYIATLNTIVGQTSHLVWRCLSWHVAFQRMPSSNMFMSIACNPVWETESDLKIGMWDVVRSSRFDMLSLAKSEYKLNIMLSSSVIVSVMWLVAHCTQAPCWHGHWECAEVVLTRPKKWGCALMTREEGFFKKLNNYSFHMYFPPFSIALNLINTLHVAADL